MTALLRREAGLRTGRRLTHVFHMTVPGSERVLLITDAAVNVQPDIETKMQAILNAVDLAHALGIEEPRVAILSGTEEATPKMPSSMEAAALAGRAKGEVSGALVHGPLRSEEHTSELQSLMRSSYAVFC